MQTIFCFLLFLADLLMTLSSACTIDNAVVVMPQLDFLVCYTQR